MRQPGNGRRVSGNRTLFTLYKKTFVARVFVYAAASPDCYIMPSAGTWSDWGLFGYLESRASARKLQRILQAAADDYNGRFACALRVDQYNTVTFIDNPRVVTARYTDQHHVEVVIDPLAVGRTPLRVWFWRLNAFYSNFSDNGPWVHMEYGLTLGSQRVHFPSIDAFNASVLVGMSPVQLARELAAFEETGPDVARYQLTTYPYTTVTRIAREFRDGSLAEVERLPMGSRPDVSMWVHHQKLLEKAERDYSADQKNGYKIQKPPFGSTLFGGYVPTWSFYSKWDKLLYPGYPSPNTQTEYAYMYERDPRHHAL